jgi:nicotinamide-nucleotide amidase
VSQEQTPRPPGGAAGDVAAELLRVLEGAGATLAVAESLTGGRLAAAVTGVPGSSAVFLGGVVSYATRVKSELLGVPAEVIAEHGVVSAACAEAMAVGVRSLVGSTWALSTTGVAGPDTQEGQPAGTVFVGVSGPAGTGSVRLALTGDRGQIQEQTCREALNLLRERAEVGE